MNFTSVNSIDFQNEFIHQPLLDSFGSFKCGKPLVCDGLFFSPQAFVFYFSCHFFFFIFLLKAPSVVQRRKMFYSYNNVFIARKNFQASIFAHSMDKYLSQTPIQHYVFYEYIRSTLYFDNICSFSVSDVHTKWLITS
jgi:hypothetical protein